MIESKHFKRSLMCLSSEDQHEIQKCYDRNCTHGGKRDHRILKNAVRGRSFSQGSSYPEQETGLDYQSPAGGHLIQSPAQDRNIPD